MSDEALEIKTIPATVRSIEERLPPGTVLVKEGKVKRGDWFYIESLGGWGLVPPVAVGTPIEGCAALVARSPKGKKLW